MVLMVDLGYLQDINEVHRDLNSNRHNLKRALVNKEGRYPSVVVAAHHKHLARVLIGAILTVWNLIAPPAHRDALTAVARKLPGEAGRHLYPDNLVHLALEADVGGVGKVDRVDPKKVAV